MAPPLYLEMTYWEQRTLFNDIIPTSVSRYRLALDMYLFRKIFASSVELLRSKMELSLMKECLSVFCGISNIFFFKSGCGEWACGGSFLVYCSLSATDVNRGDLGSSMTLTMALPLLSVIGDCTSAFLLCFMLLCGSRGSENVHQRVADAQGHRHPGPCYSPTVMWVCPRCPGSTASSASARCLPGVWVRTPYRLRLSPGGVTLEPVRDPHFSWAFLDLQCSLIPCARVRNFIHNLIISTK